VNAITTHVLAQASAHLLGLNAYTSNGFVKHLPIRERPSIGSERRIRPLRKIEFRSSTEVNTDRSRSGMLIGWPGPANTLPRIPSENRREYAVLKSGRSCRDFVEPASLGNARITLEYQSCGSSGKRWTARQEQCLNLPLPCRTTAMLTSSAPPIQREIEFTCPDILGEGGPP